MCNRHETAPETTTLEIWKGADAELRVGGLRLVACRREIDTIDGGVSLYVWEDVLDRPARELLRVDLFRERPHYHAPATEERETRIDAGPEGSLAWGVGAITTRVAELLAEAGFGAVASQLDPTALAAAGPQIRALFAGLPEPTERSTFEVPAAMVRGLRG